VLTDAQKKQSLLDAYYSYKHEINLAVQKKLELITDFRKQLDNKRISILQTKMATLVKEKENGSR
jgi:hypothetical protein